MLPSQLTHRQLLDLHTKASMSLTTPAAHSLFGSSIVDHLRKVEDELLRRLSETDTLRKENEHLRGDNAELLAMLDAQAFGRTGGQ